MQILLTNDDGIQSPGIKSLAKALQSLGQVTVVAPATEQSGISHALTFRTPLFVRELTWDNGMKVWSVEGTPADCARIGILNLCEKRPDIVVSGLNHGLNIGCNVVYSGTVAGAEEGAILGIDSFAVSLEYDELPPWDKASALTTQIIRQIIDAKVNSERANLININVPLSACYSEQPTGVCVVPVDQTPHTDAYSSRQGPYGVPYYWLTGHVIPGDPTLNTDRVMVKKGYITVTPLECNRTNRRAIETLELAFVAPHHEKPTESFAKTDKDSSPTPFIRVITDESPDSSEELDELFEPGIDLDDPPQASQDDNADHDYNVSSKPPKGHAKGMIDKSSPYSEGT
ncbi:MAG: 5'/3'-nucleotidase SurE [Planctomycetaceae bacterium]|nr:5'/3'-nucleotidase SurE [Planctomycetaceae bacterium]